MKYVKHLTYFLNVLFENFILTKETDVTLPQHWCMRRVIHLTFTKRRNRVWLTSDCQDTFPSASTRIHVARRRGHQFRNWQKDYKKRVRWNVKYQTQDQVKQRVIKDLPMRLLHKPTENPVKPAMAPWTAFWASCIQYRLSAAFAGIDRIMYEGSMYLWKRRDNVSMFVPITIENHW